MHQSTEIIDGKCSETKVAGGATVGIGLLGENLLFSVSFTHRNSSNLPNRQECLIRSLVDLLVETFLTSKALIHENHLFVFKAHHTEIHHHMAINTDKIEIENH